MAILRGIVFAAVTAGLIVGLLITLVQQLGTEPLILRGETYETAAATTAPNDGATAAATHAHAAGEAHEHAAEAWEPAAGFERNVYTLAANVLTGIGFGLLLTGAYVLRGRPVGWREGLMWGLAGFAVFMVAPGLGLPPELPGLPVAPLGERQVWWLATALATAAGLGLIVFRRELWAAALGAALIVAPHVWGAPPPPDVATNVPESLAHLFVVAATVTTFVFWVLLGGLTGALYRRFAGDS